MMSAVGPGQRQRWDDAQEAIFRARVLLSSYAPLNFIMVARLHHWDVLRWTFLAVGLWGVGDALRVTVLASKTQAVKRAFIEVRDSGSEIAAYLATYLLPLLAAPTPSAGDVIGYAIYGLMIAVITLRSDLAHVNPTLYALGWKVVSVTASNGDQRYLVCRSTPGVGEEVMVTEMNGLLHRNS